MEQKVPIILKHVLDVTELVFHEKYSERTAMEVIAERERVWITTIKDECRRQIGLNAAEFSDLLKNKNDVAIHLTKLYPKHVDVILSRLGS